MDDFLSGSLNAQDVIDIIHEVETLGEGLPFELGGVTADRSVPATGSDDGRKPEDPLQQICDKGAELQGKEPLVGSEQRMSSLTASGRVKWDQRRSEAEQEIERYLETELPTLKEELLSAPPRACCETESSIQVSSTGGHYQQEPGYCQEDPVLFSQPLESHAIPMGRHEEIAATGWEKLPTLGVEEGVRGQSRAVDLQGRTTSSPDADESEYDEYALFGSPGALHIVEEDEAVGAQADDDTGWGG